MKSEDLDELLLNIDGNEDEIALQKKIQENKSGSSSVIQKQNNNLNQNSKDNISFLEEIDSSTSNDYAEYNNIPEEKLSPEDVSEILGTKSEQANKEVNEASEPITNNKSAIEFETVKFILKGTRTWNTREPYIAPVNTEKLKADHEDLNATFYFISEPGKESFIIGEMKRSMIKYIKGSRENITDDYSQFLINKISFHINALGSNFGFQGDRLYFFIYHTGVLTLHSIIMNEFKSSKIGYCFKLMAGNSLVKYIPSEYIKEMILKWHNDNFNNRDLPYDGIIEFNELKKQISSRYSEEVEKYNSRIETLTNQSNINTKSSAEREQFIKSKRDEFFGNSVILIYNRFLERTMFKSIK